MPSGIPAPNPIFSPVERLLPDRIWEADEIEDVIVDVDDEVKEGTVVDKGVEALIVVAEVVEALIVVTEVVVPSET
jgi:hypothetical protein